MIDKPILYTTRKEHACRGYADHIVIDEATSYFAQGIISIASNNS